jgi:hypothetical protein
MSDLNMNNTHNKYDFESLLQDIIDDSYGLNEVKNKIKNRLKTDTEFSNLYKKWKEYNGFDSWMVYYKNYESEIEEESKDDIWDVMFQNGDEDDSITDYLTK